MPEPAVLECRSLNKFFNQQHVIQDFSFTVEPGSICGLLGPNGAGKTTLIRMILDFFRPDSGQVLLFGQAPSAETRDRIGYLPEERGLYRRSRIVDILQYLARLHNVPPEKSTPFITRQLEEVGLGSHMHKRTQELSKGMLQKVQLIASFVHQPDFLILDEPFSGLDPLNVQVALKMIADQKARGATILLSAHQMALAQLLCDKLVMVNQGRRVLYGSMEDIQAEHATNRVSLTGPRTLDGLPGGAVATCLRDDQWEIDCRGQEPRTILEFLVNQHVAVESFSLRKPSLEEIFLKVARSTDL